MLIQSNDDFVLCQDKFTGNFPNFPAFNRVTTVKYGDCGYNLPTDELLRTHHLTREANCDYYFKLRVQPRYFVEIVRPNGLVHNYSRSHGLICFNQGQKIALLSNTADCPILYMTTSDCRFIAIVHCGWRPLYFNIVIQAIDLIQEKSCIEPREIQAAIWPGICFSCYKVGDEFEKYFPGKIRKNRFDLAEEVRAQLELSGVYNIMMAEPIKFCSAHTLDSGQFVFHSRRRERNGCMNSALIAF